MEQNIYIYFLNFSHLFTTCINIMYAVSLWQHIRSLFASQKLEDRRKNAKMGKQLSNFYYH